MNFQKTLMTGGFVTLSGIAAAANGCGGADTAVFDNDPTTETDGGTDAMMDADASTDVVDSGKMGDANAEDGGINCAQVTVSFNGPPAMAIEQGVFDVKLICLDFTTSCHDQVLAALNFQTTGTLNSKDFTNSYSLRNSLDKPVGTTKNPSVTGELNFDGLSDALTAGTPNELCLFANISISAPVASTIGLKVPKGGVSLADPKTPIVPNADIIGNTHMIATKK